jgi:hypothetical protein
MKKNMTIFDDPIVAEVRRYRQANAAKFGYNIRAIAEDARSREKTSGHVVLQPPRRKSTRGRKRSGSTATG